MILTKEILLEIPPRDVFCVDGKQYRRVASKGEPRIVLLRKKDGRDIEVEKPITDVIGKEAEYHESNSA
jgi:hypothetical protein